MFIEEKKGVKKHLQKGYPKTGCQEKWQTQNKTENPEKNKAKYYKT